MRQNKLPSNEQTNILLFILLNLTIFTFFHYRVAAILEFCIKMKF